jgi:hypothetical protein
LKDLSLKGCYLFGKENVLAVYKGYIIHIGLKEILASEVVPSDTDISVLLTIHLPSLSLSHTWLDPLLARQRATLAAEPKLAIRVMAPVKRMSTS